MSHKIMEMGERVGYVELFENKAERLKTDGSIT